MAAQDFRHTVQGETELVADFIRRLERTFQIAYGRDGMSTETRDTLLHSQLQEGLRYDLMRGSAVSGAQTYKELALLLKTKRNVWLNSGSGSNTRSRHPSWLNTSTGRHPTKREEIGQHRGDHRDSYRQHYWKRDSAISARSQDTLHVTARQPSQRAGGDKLHISQN